MASNNEKDISEVISELSRIDDAAENVLIHTESNKQAYDEKNKKRIAKYNNELQKEIKTQLAEYEKALRSNRNKDLIALREETTQTITSLDEWYKNNHSEIAQNILASFIKE